MKLGIVTLVLLNLASKLSAAEESIETDTNEGNNEAVINCHAQAKLNFDNCVLWNHGTHACKEELSEFLKRCLPRNTGKKRKKNNSNDNSEEYTMKTKMCHSQANLNFDHCVIWSLSIGSCENQRVEYLSTCLPRMKLKKHTVVKNPTTLLQVAPISIKSLTTDQSNSKEGGPENPILRNGDTVYKNNATQNLTHQSSTIFQEGSTTHENTTKHSSKLDSPSITSVITHSSFTDGSVKEKDRETASNQSSTISIDNKTSSIQNTTEKSRILRHNLNEPSSSEKQRLWPWLQPTEDDVTTDKFSFLERIVNF